MTWHGSRSLRWDPEDVTRGRAPLLLRSMARSAARLAAFFGLLLAFAFQCAAAAVLAIGLGLAASGHRAGPGPAGALGIAVGLGLTIATLSLTVRGIYTLNASLLRVPTPPPAPRPAAGPLDPLWDRDLDGGLWPWIRG